MMQNLEVIITGIVTLVTSVIGTRTYEKWRRNKGKLDILDEQMDRIEDLSQKLLENESKLHKVAHENILLRVAVDKYKSDAEKWRSQKSSNNDGTSD